MTAKYKRHKPLVFFNEGETALLLSLLIKFTDGLDQRFPRAAGNAERFLLDLGDAAPFPILSI